jgi:hypothetical protein
VVDVKPIFDHLPNSNRKAAIEEEVRGRCVMAPAKGAHSPIGPSSLLYPGICDEASLNKLIMDWKRKKCVM